ncbi:MAG: phospho-N-acetylmuramoyl-pentapeptide-transferase [Candidatus Sericytochromatia bacterium]|nr:phospho-N-acetylmuramoyl-pentapeptide-transferase [Candidatus Sericytochromatia bacterium]
MILHPSTLAAIALAAAIGGLLTGRAVVDVLRRLKAGQAIRDEGPQSHKAKGGTPTMGGIILITPALVLPPLLTGGTPAAWLFSAILLGFALVGGLDDWLIIKYRNNKGLPGRLKLLAQLLLGAAWGYALIAMGENHPLLVPYTELTIPLGLWRIPVCAFVFASATNAVNLTDGLDGLASGTGIICLLPLMMLVASLPMTALSTAAMIAAASVIGGLIAFLWFNWHPAQVFMGDLGSLALGAAITPLASSAGAELWLVIVGGVFVVETLSVISQVISFQTTGKRIWRMSPLHHHFELGGWPETKVVGRFYLAACLCALVTVLGIKSGVRYQPTEGPRPAVTESRPTTR